MLVNESQTGPKCPPCIPHNWLPEKSKGPSAKIPPKLRPKFCAEIFPCKSCCKSAVFHFTMARSKFGARNFRQNIFAHFTLTKSKKKLGAYFFLTPASTGRKKKSSPKILNDSIGKNRILIWGTIFPPKSYLSTFTTIRANTFSDGWRLVSGGHVKCCRKTRFRKNSHRARSAKT